MNQIEKKVGKISIECMMNPSSNSGLDTMKVTSLEITDTGGISHLKLDNVDPQINIICGENGVGKTNILDSIALLFSSYTMGGITTTKGKDSGKISILLDGSEYSASVVEKEPVTNWASVNINRPIDKTRLLYLKTNRSFEYEKITNLSAGKSIEESSNQHTKGVDSKDLKNWLVVRKGFSPENLTETEKQNSELVSRCFSIVNDEYSFSSAKANFEVYVKTPSSNGHELHFELLSSGFKSIVFMLVGIIKELDIRFKDVMPAVDYDGVILIDEVELHLHPEWQGKICSILKKVFPKAQFFITTHSPHVVQTAGKDEVIALQRVDGNVIKRDLPTSEYGYQGWTVEEILEDVMGMPDLRTTKYKEIKSRFDKALDDNDREAAQAAYDELDKMLHPNYPLRPVFRMQLDNLGE